MHVDEMLSVLVDGTPHVLLVLFSGVSAILLAVVGAQGGLVGGSALHHGSGDSLAAGRKREGSQTC